MKSSKDPSASSSSCRSEPQEAVGVSGRRFAAWALVVVVSVLPVATLPAQAQSAGASGSRFTKLVWIGAQLGRDVERIRDWFEAELDSDIEEKEREAREKGDWDDYERAALDLIDKTESKLHRAMADPMLAPLRLSAERVAQEARDTLARELEVERRGTQVSELRHRWPGGVRRPPAAPDPPPPELDEAPLGFSAASSVQSLVSPALRVTSLGMTALAAAPVKGVSGSKNAPRVRRGFLGLRWPSPIQLLHSLLSPVALSEAGLDREVDLRLPPHEAADVCSLGLATGDEAWQRGSYGLEALPSQGIRVIKGDYQYSICRSSFRKVSIDPKQVPRCNRLRAEGLAEGCCFPPAGQGHHLRLLENAGPVCCSQATLQCCVRDGGDCDC